MVLNSLGLVAWMQGDYGIAKASMNEALGLCRETAYTHSVAVALGSLSNIAQEEGDSIVARRKCLESLARYEQCGDIGR